jgi:hypothetical protein
MIRYALLICAVVALGCSDDGVYTPANPPEEVEPEPVAQCQFIDETLCDGGIDAAKGN